MSLWQKQSWKDSSVNWVKFIGISFDVKMQRFCPLICKYLLVTSFLYLWVLDWWSGKTNNLFSVWLSFRTANWFSYCAETNENQWLPVKVGTLILSFESLFHSCHPSNHSSTHPSTHLSIHLSPLVLWPHPCILLPIPPSFLSIRPIYKNIWCLRLRSAELFSRDL